MWTFENPFLDSGDITNPFDPPSTDDTHDEVEGLSFLSGMYPSNRWVIGGFRHELANYRTEVHSTGTVINPGIGQGQGPMGKFVRPLDGVYDLEITSWGVSAAGELTRNFALGVALVWNQMELESRTERLDAIRNTEVPNIPPTTPQTNDSTDENENLGYFLENDGTSTSPARICCRFSDRGDVRNFETQEGDDEDLTLNVGLLWQSTKKRVLEPVFAIGLVYREGARLVFEGNTFARRLGGVDGNLTRFFQPSVGAAGPGPWTGYFNVPDVWGLGVSLSPADRWVVSADVNRVEYSDLVQETLDITGADGMLGEIERPAISLAVDDGTEYRFGVQYEILGGGGGADVFLRAGSWLDPNHSLDYVGGDPALDLLYVSGDDELHYSGGLGLRLPSFQLDLGLDFTSRIDTIALSAVFFFGGE
jgi:hypothetical protein